MKNLILTLVLLPSLIFAQYYYERSTEQNFETSDFYFKRYVFNPFGMLNFREVTQGLIDNPFLNISLNPANITGLKERLSFYIDYRGEYNAYEPEIFRYPIPLEPQVITNVIDRIAPVYISQARREPEPKFSIGVITAPFNSLSDKFFVGATFQRINKAEKFYSMPYWIYYPVWGYDPFGNRYAQEGSYPSIERYSGKDEMVTQANLFSIFTGYKISEKFSAGFQISGINHSREGGYRDKYDDDYGNIDNTISRRDYLIERNRDYKQFDYTLGLAYMEGDSRIGIKLGLLNGKAEQVSNNLNLSYYQYNKPDISPTWNVNYMDYNTNQSWKNSGSLYLMGFDVFHKINQDIHLIGYFNYTSGNIDIQNSSSIKDTSEYYSKYTSYDQAYWNIIRNNYSIIDIRTGTGTKKKSDYSGLIGLRWNISPKIKVTFGLAYFEYNLDVNSKEPVVYSSSSKHDYTTNQPGSNNKRSYLRVYEEKNLEWHFNSVNFTYQIPVIFEFKLSDKIELGVLVNQVSGGSQVSEYTDAFIMKRIRTEDDSTRQFNNFIERYREPSIKTTFEKTDLISSVKFYLHPNLNFSFLIDPMLVPFIGISQVFFSIEGRF